MSGTRSLKWPIGDAGSLPASVCRPAAAVVLGLLNVAAAVVVSRAMAGALTAPLEPAVLLTAGVLVAAAAAAVRLGWLLPRAANRSRRLDLVVMALASLAAIALGVGLCSPCGTPSAGVYLLGIIVLAEEGWAWIWFFQKCHNRGQGRLLPTESPIRLRTHETKTPDPFIEVVQQLTRSRGADGAEELSGWLRAPFATGQRTGSVHVAFCPPLGATPELTVEQTEGPDARIKAAQVLPYGARFDLKLAAAAESPTTVLLQFSALSRSNDTAPIKQSGAE